MKSRQLTLVSILCVLNHGVEAFVGSFNNAKFRSGTIRSYATASVDTIEDSYDVTIVGSGIGGLSCAAMLALYGYKVAVFESHYAPGGAAHGYSVKGKNGGLYHFDTGPSFFSGLNPNIDAKLSNPLRTILDAIGEEVECIPYKTFGLLFPEGSFTHTTEFGKKGGVLDQVSGEKAISEWANMMEKMEPLASAVDALPTVALRSDLGVALTAGPFLKNFAKTNPLENLKLTKPFSAVLNNAGVNDKFARNWLDLLCFCLSGLPADGTITAEMAMMMGEFYEPTAIMDCPRGGAKSIIDALVRGIEKRGGKIFLNQHVKSIIIENGRATSIQLKKGDKVVKANKAVVSNLSVWDLFGSGIIDPNAFPSNFVKERKETPVGKSFMHLHLAFKATKEELEKLEAHYMYMDSWDRGVEAEDNAVLVSIPSVHDDTLAPDGEAVLHAYTPATEDYERWVGLDRKSNEYKELKEERSQYLWKVLEKIIPDIRSRVTHTQVGTPLTHQRFLNRHKGSYGPAIRAGEASFPFPTTPVKGLLVTGDSCFPGIGVPATAGSGLLTASSVSLDSIKPQLKVLEELQRKI
ncbi:phytoene dehydrogenase, phytoene desaturase and carotenoid isomerase-like protein [Chaetoceros tenuissimus]|uniref:Phytoene dehydrogenase, phytoene desaturase and carotenoid isomerase-like protein n=1 Tax=Chaetoceros tenuissimus TaxID=426638 RepID=A0AAD3D7C2_9STRA|nr:phytoene dehydrogenase, phytoene desaturase and carotenoid isomerase-like protein [Chaetoceros tenuissimus]